MKSLAPATRYRTLILGAIDGLVYSGVLLFLIQQHNEYLLRRIIEEEEKFGTPPVQLTMNNSLNVKMIVLFLVVIFAATSCLVHRYEGWIRKSSILFWGAVGVAAITAWNVLALSLMWFEKLFTGRGVDYDRISSSTGLMFGPKSFVLVITINIIYASVIILSVKVHSKLTHQRP